MGVNRFIDRAMLSQALLEYVRNRLASKGQSPTQTAIAEEIGVRQPMISQVQTDKTRSFARQTITRYASKLDKSEGELVMELMGMVPEPDPLEDTMVPPVDPKDTLEQVVKEVEIIRRMLMSEKRHGKCVADQFYGRVARKAYSLLRRCNVPVTAAALCFCHGERARWLVGNEQSRPRGQHAIELIGRVPDNLASAMYRALDKEEQRLVETCTIVRPGETGEHDMDRFWAVLTGVEATRTAKRFRVYSARVYVQQPTSTAVGSGYSICFLFFLGGEHQVNEQACRAMWLMAELAHRIHSIELQAQAESIMRLSGLTLLPNDVRPHRMYYPAAGSSCNARLELNVDRFLERLSRHKKIHRIFATADIWSYDWSLGEYLCLSSYFRLVDREVAERMEVVVDGEVLTFGDAYERAFASLTPRTIGKTSFILLSRRALVVEDPKCSGATSCLAHPELDLGSFIGLPIVLTDKDNDRRIHSVLYMRCRKVVHQAHELVPIIAKIANSCEGIECDLAPAMTSKTQTDAEVLPIMREPERVSMVAVGPTDVAVG